MAINIGDLQMFLSGGASNTDTTLSVGDVISSTMIESQEATTTVSEYVIVDAFNNAVGLGELGWNTTTNSITWKPYGSGTVSVPITADGTYMVGDANGYIVISTYSNYPTETGGQYATLAAGADKLDSNVSITNVLEAAWDDISAQESLDGRIEYRCFYLKNTHGTTSASNVTVWIKEQPSGADTLDISVPRVLTVGDSPINSGDGLDDEIDTGADLDPTPTTGNILPWDNPSTQGTGIDIGTLTAGQYMAIWQRRTIAADTYTKEPNDKSVIGISAIL